MINKQFGVADPQYDALRVQSNQAVWPDAGGAPPGGIGGLENKIYLWHSNGSTIDTFDPDETGLNDALTVAVSGDTVWLPSISIPMTAALTIPGGVALTGISHNSILSFSGFAGSCIVLSADSIISDFTVDHSDGKWIEASADGAKVLRMHGTAKRAVSGINLVPLADEIWFATTQDVVFAIDAFNGEPDFHAVSPRPYAVGKEIAAFGAGYLADNAFVIDTDNKIWSLDNVAALRANPATTAAWTQILGPGTDVGFGTVSYCSAFTMWGDELIGYVHTSTNRNVHCRYDGSWHYTNPADNFGNTMISVARDYVSTHGQILSSTYLTPTKLTGAPALELIGPISAAAKGGWWPWENLISTVYFVSTSAKNVPSSGYHQCVVIRGTNVAGTQSRAGSFTSSNVYTPSGTMRIRGAWNAARVWAVDPNDGQLYIADDGTAFVTTGANGVWAGTTSSHQDIVMNQQLDGLGKFIWMRGDVANGANFLRYSDDDFATAASEHKGNFWTDIQPSGSLAMIDFYLKYH